MIPTSELRAFFDAIATHAIELVADVDPQDVYAGNVVYRASNGWTLIVFNDANEYDYVNSVVSADGRETGFDEPALNDLNWEPDDALVWRCFGIPGYCTFRCTVCGAQIPNASQRGRAMSPPFLCGDDRCVGEQQPANGTWIRVGK